MKSSGILRRIDDLGRIVLPIEIRRTLDWKDGDRIEILPEGDRVILSKYEERCCFCGNDRTLREFRGKQVCAGCIRRLGAL